MPSSKKLIVGAVVLLMLPLFAGSLSAKPDTTQQVVYENDFEKQVHPSAAATMLQEAQQLYRAWSKQRRPSDTRRITSAQEREARAAMANRTFRRAVNICQTIYSSYPKSDAAPEAVFLMSVMYEQTNMHDECIKTCRILLDEYSNARISSVVGNCHHFNTYRRLGDSLAAIGQHKEAVEAYIQSILSAESQGYQHSGLVHLLLYEPEYPIDKLRQELPKDFWSSLDKAVDDISLRIELSSPKRLVTKDEPVTLVPFPVRPFRVRNFMD